MKSITIILMFMCDYIILTASFEMIQKEGFHRLLNSKIVEAEIVKTKIITSVPQPFAVDYYFLYLNDVHNLINNDYTKNDTLICISNLNEPIELGEKVLLFIRNERSQFIDKLEINYKNQIVSEPDILYPNLIDYTLYLDLIAEFKNNDGLVYDKINEVSIYADIDEFNRFKNIKSVKYDNGISYKIDFIHDNYIVLDSFAGFEIDYERLIYKPLDKTLQYFKYNNEKLELSKEITLSTRHNVLKYFEDAFDINWFLNLIENEDSRREFIYKNRKLETEQEFIINGDEPKTTFNYINIGPDFLNNDKNNYIVFPIYSIVSIATLLIIFVLIMLFYKYRK